MNSPDWHRLQHRLGLHDPKGFAAREIAPLLEAIPVDRLKNNGDPENRLELPLGVGFFGFIIVFLGLGVVLPDTLIGVALRIILFPVLFLAMIGASLYFFKARVIRAIADGKERFIARSAALNRLAGALDLTYVPSPGGAPTALKVLARFRWAPPILREAADVLDQAGGMDETLDIARRAGVMTGAATVLGTEDQKDAYAVQAAAQAQVEDGFQGQRDGVAFNAFEWVESVDDAPDVHHLVLVFKAPRRLYGVTQLRSRGVSWPYAPGQGHLQPVGVVAPAFEDRFRMRSSDQTEARYLFDPVVIERVAAIAHGETVRAAAFDDALVIDAAGKDRFAMVDLVTGAWSEETIAETMINIADMLALADAIAHAFKLRDAA